MANMREVARRAGVSVGTVSRYLNGMKIRQDNAEAVARAVKELDYHPSIIGRALTTQRSYAIGILVASVSNVFVSSSIAEMETLLERRGYSSLFMDFHGDVNILKQKITLLRQRCVDGLIIFLSEVDAHRLEFLDAVDVPVIVIDNPVEHGDIDSIVVDNAQSSAAMVGAMLDAGHRRVGIVAPSQETYVGRRRLEGWASAFERRGLPVVDDDVRLCPPLKAEGYKAMISLLDSGAVTAVFAGNYYLALGALKAINSRGIRPGCDIGFASFDDFDFSDVMYPPLSVIRQPMHQITEKAVERMCDRLDGCEDPYGICTLSCSVQTTNSICGGIDHVEGCLVRADRA